MEPLQKFTASTNTTGVVTQETICDALFQGKMFKKYIYSNQHVYKHKSLDYDVGNYDKWCIMDGWTKNTNFIGTLT